MTTKQTGWAGFLLLPAMLMAFSAAGFAQNKQDSKNGKSSNDHEQVSSDQRAARSTEALSKEVNHQLVMLPWYSVFDNIEYRVDNNGVVTLQGQVVQDTTKHDAESHVKGIEGVTKINNNIELLPASPNDDRIRRAAYRAIFGEPALEKYSFGTVQPVHIIVKDGHVTLTGAVLNEGDRNLAEIRAKGIPGVFSVTNNLKIENSKTEAQDARRHG